MVMYMTSAPPRARGLAEAVRPARRRGSVPAIGGWGTVEHPGGGDEPLGPVDPLVVPRFAGPATFARLPRLDQVDRCDVAVVGGPFDAGTTYPPGARVGPAAIPARARVLRGNHARPDRRPFAPPPG